MASNLANWIPRLLLPSGRVESVSDAGLQALLARKFSTTPLGGLKNIQAVPELHDGWDFHVADVLLRLGEHTFPSAGKRLGTLARFAPVLKYMFAFEDDGTGRIVTSDVIQMAAYRSRGVVSEELGVGFSLIAAERWVRKTLGLTNVRFFDIELVAGKKYPNANHTVGPGRGLRADWLVKASSATNPQKEFLFLLESKGTGRTNSHEGMLEKAVQQLAATTIDGRALQGLGVCTYSGFGGLTIYAIDPPGNYAESDWPYLITPSPVGGSYGELREMAGEWRELPKSLNDEELESPQRLFGMELMSEPLSRLTALQSALNFAHWTSDYALLESLHKAYGTPRPKRSRSQLETEMRLETSRGLATGYALRIPGCGAAIFAGALKEVSSALAEHDFVGATAITAEHDSVRAGHERPTAEGTESGNLAISDSGAVLALVNLSAS